MKEVSLPLWSREGRFRWKIPVEENIGQVFHMIEALKEPHCQIFFIHPEVKYRTEVT